MSVWLMQCGDEACTCALHWAWCKYCDSRGKKETNSINHWCSWSQEEPRLRRGDRWAENYLTPSRFLSAPIHTVSHTEYCHCVRSVWRENVNMTFRRYNVHHHTCGFMSNNKIRKTTDHIRAGRTQASSTPAVLCCFRPVHSSHYPDGEEHSKWEQGLQEYEHALTCRAHPLHHKGMSKKKTLFYCRRRVLKVILENTVWRMDKAFLLRSGTTNHRLTFAWFGLGNRITVIKVRERLWLCCLC